MEPVFRYIFIAIAGAIILLFFISLSIKQLDIGGKLTSTEIRETLNNAFIAFSVSENSDKSIDIKTNKEVYIKKNAIL